MFYVIHPIFQHHPFYRHVLVLATFLWLGIFGAVFVMSGPFDSKEKETERKDNEEKES